MRVAYALVGHEARLLVSLLLWARRRQHGVGEGRAFGYARGQGAMTAGLLFVCAIESFTMSVLLRGRPTAHLVVLVLDGYTIVFVAGLYAAWAVRPHVLYGDVPSGDVLSGGVLRVRHAAHVDLRVPLERIATVRRELRTTHGRTGDTLDLPVGSRTSVTLELTRPVDHFTFFGRPRPVRVVRLHADDPQGLVAALTRARTVPSVPSDRPG